jgi:hypothetical protein
VFQEVEINFYLQGNIEGGTDFLVQLKNVLTTGG